MSNTAMANTAQALMDSMTPKFAVSYLRVSTRGQAERGGGNDEGFSIPAQREANKKKALSMGAIVGKEFVDRGASAKSADRPQLQAMLEYVRENADRIDYVIVHKVDRLARNRGDDIDIMRTLRECGVQLVSASESIDDTPAGMLLHGIMSSIAEFYSQNLATEVKKGMGEKVKNGGTIGRAPIGYMNVRRVDDKGREERTVVLDPERAPLIKIAFEEYATGNWTVAELAEHLAACGLTTRSTPKIPSVPITLKTLHKVLVNPYYKGVVVYKNVQHEGSHEPIVSIETWDKVQKIEQIYDNYQLSPEIRQYLEEYLQSIVLKEREKFNSELDGLNRTKTSLEHKRQKLLEAHYSDAIPLDLMKSEQKKIAKELASIEHEINMHNVTFENILANLHLALDLIEDCGTTYRAANDMTKRLINQALVSRFLVSNGNDGVNIDVEFKAPFDTILEPIKDAVARINQARRNGLKELNGLTETTKNHVRIIYGCDFHVSDSPNPIYSELTSNEPNFFMVKSSSKDLLVDLAGIEPIQIS